MLSKDEDTGLDICLSCFNGGCTGDRQHALLHSNRTKHPLSLNIRRVRKKINSDEPQPKVSKLAIAAETESDRYDTTTRVRCYDCAIDNVDQTKGNLPMVINGVLTANTFAKQEEVKAWEQEMVACEHTLCLEQDPSREIASQDLGKCYACDLKENLWLCLTCGNLGCGRAQFGGVGGNSHALSHGSETFHSVAVKLGSLTADGNADIYCYACNDEKIDPELATHLAHWGINIADRQKTEKSLTEMQIEQNLKWDFSMTTEDGKELTPLFGPGFTGLKNIGNTCYMASVVQALFAMPEYAERYNRPNDPLPEVEKPAEDLETQLRKMADGLLSGRYSKPDSDVIASEHSPEVPYQKGLLPAMLKHLVGRGHPEFSTMRQQDAFELLLHLMKLITRSQHSTPLRNPVDAFKFAMEQRLQCLSCKKVRYRSDEQDNISVPVPIRRKAKESRSNSINGEEEEFEPVTLKECLDQFTAAEIVELQCSGCGSKDGFSKRTMFKTVPTILAVNARRFEIVNWLPTKQDVPVIVDDGLVSFDEYMSPGKTETEELLPVEDDARSQPSSSPFIPNDAALSMLESMGFPRNRCVRALHATCNADPEAASNWLFAHMEDPNIDDPLDLEGEKGASGSSAGKSSAVDADKIEALGNMGFSAPLARQALKETGGDMERAVDWLFNHPEATGDYDTGNQGESENLASDGEDKAGALPGNDALPANFQLQSIVCHKGRSIHAGYVNALEFFSLLSPILETFDISA